MHPISDISCSLHFKDGRCSQFFTGVLYMVGPTGKLYWWFARYFPSAPLCLCHACLVEVEIFSSVATCYWPQNYQEKACERAKWLVMITCLSRIMLSRCIWSLSWKGHLARFFPSFNLKSRVKLDLIVY